MTTEGSQLAAAAGLVIYADVCDIIFNSGLCGVYLLAFAIALNILVWVVPSVRTNRRSYSLARHQKAFGRAHKAMTLLVSLGSVLEALLLSMGIILSLSSLGSIKFLGQLSSPTLLVATFIIDACAENLMYLMADVVIAWRAWAIWAENRLVRFILAIMLLVDIGVSIADMTVDAEEDIKELSIDSVTLDWLAVVINLTLNIMATLLIVYRAWIYNKSVRAIKPSTKTQAETILLLFIESGALLAAIQILDIVIVILDSLDVDADVALSSPLDSAASLIAAFYIFSAALNPIAIIILVQTKNTYEYSFHHEDEPSLQVQSIEADNMSPTRNQPTRDVFLS